MFLNVSGKNQCLQNKYTEYKTVHPNEVISEQVFPIVEMLPKNQFKKIKKINFEKAERILFRRGHALGDVVMTFPIVNYFKKKGKKVEVRTGTKYSIPGVEFVKDNPKIYHEDYDLIIDLNWVVERDHYEEDYFAVNRVDIYKEYLNLKDIGNDWSVDFLEVDVDIGGAPIAVQLRGSTAAKNMNIIPLLNELERRKIKFYVIDDLGEYKDSYKSAVVNPTDVVGLLNVFKNVKAVLTFDSGVLWLSHVTNTPAFVITGPTCGEKLIQRHPNSNTMYYDTKLDYGCKQAPRGCGEGGIECGGNFSCLENVNYSRFISEFMNWTKSL
jgi:hypothetical protein